MSNFTIPRPLKAALVAGALLGLGGCTYGGAGYYGDGYVNNQRYECDPYAPFDDYYACDYGYGFANIGYGGGWYDQYYYPGYGVYIFDRGGRRHAMRDNHRRYWARQRAEYGGHHARDRNWNQQQRVDRRDQRYRRGDGIRDQRRGNYRDERGTRPGTRAERRGNRDQINPLGNRRDRTGTGRIDRQPGVATQRPQSRPQPAARPATTSRSPRPEGPRVSPRTSRSARERIADD